MYSIPLKSSQLLGSWSREVYRPSDGRPRGASEAADPIRTAHKLTTHSKPFLFLLSLPPLPLFSIEPVSHLTKVVHNKAGDIFDRRYETPDDVYAHATWHSLSQVTMEDY